MVLLYYYSVNVHANALAIFVKAKYKNK
jgi:hypothetical protein